VVLALPRASSDRAALGLVVYAIVFGIVILLAALRFRRRARSVV
jgi:preprotein translocase subunit Sec63